MTILEEPEISLFLRFSRMYRSAIKFSIFVIIHLGLGRLGFAEPTQTQKNIII